MSSTDASADLPDPKPRGLPCFSASSFRTAHDVRTRPLATTPEHDPKTDKYQPIGPAREIGKRNTYVWPIIKLSKIGKNVQEGSVPIN